MLENTKNIVSMENARKFNITVVERGKINSLFALKIRDIGFRKFVTDGEAKEVKRKGEYMFVHVKGGTFLRIVERGKGDDKKNLLIILTPEANASKYKTCVQFLADF